MENKTEIKYEKIEPVSVYFAAVGLAAVIFGIADILVWCGFSGGIELGIIEISGDDFFRQVWGGLVVIFGGLFILSGFKGIKKIHQFSKVILGSAMIWIIAGCDIFAMVCEGIPAAEEAPEFLNSLSGFIEGFMPPFAPAVVLLPFTFVIIYIYYSWGFGDESKY
ncbi:MAG: hypothetical protein JXQ82_02035 [Methanomicrobiaceae archaeon]|nr:hypothetical protein [Methanomicrobiaceae archaeon]